jgi:hypothetical protein
MGITTYSKFDLFKDKIYSLSTPLQKGEIISNSFLLEQSHEKNLSVYYAPVEYFNKNATILIVGITPGFHQMQKAYSAVIRVKEELIDNEEILHQAKLASSYEGPMRKNLIQMLDELELPGHLGLPSSAALFGSANHVVHTTGLIPYPVFYKNRNYTGSTPNILTTEILKKYVMTYFVNDVSRLQNPVIIPLGVTVSKVLSHFAGLNLLDHTHLLSGFPHPSGANGHHFKQFAQNKDRLKKELANYFT